MTKVTIDRALIEQAVDVINSECGYGGSNSYEPRAIAEALRAALAETAKQGQEPVTWSNPYQEILESNRIGVEVANKVKRKIHTSPPPPPAEPAAEPVKFLANGTRFKMSFFHNEDSEGQVAEGMYVTCFEGFEDELNGRWVALVPAEDDCHMKLKASPQAPAEPVRTSQDVCTVPLLSDEEILQLTPLWFKKYTDGVLLGHARAIEQLVRRKAGL